MNILIIGDEQRYTALQRKGGLVAHQVLWIPELTDESCLAQQELVIDLNFDEFTGRAAFYAKFPALPVLACIVKTSLAAVRKEFTFTIIGCNWLPGFTDMPVTEVALFEASQQPLLAHIMDQLGWQYELVQDGVGMVTPRVVCMIINEAYMAAHAGTANREDIDTAMRLGTNYPMGPFEWSRKIGVQQVYNVLAAVQQVTGNERYGISTLLEQEAKMI